MEPDELAFKQKGYKLEVWRVGLSILTPLVLVVLTFVVNSAIQERGATLKREEQVLAEKQKIYAGLGQRLNVIYVYIADVGDFRSYTPPRVVEMKREADRQFFSYRPYWSDATEKAYVDYMNSAFSTYTGAGLPAKINASDLEKKAAYAVDKLQWDSGWDTYFSGRADESIGKKYYALVSSLLADTTSAKIRSIDQ